MLHREALGVPGTRTGSVCSASGGLGTLAVRGQCTDEEGLGDGLGITRQSDRGDVPFGSGLPVHEPGVPAASLAIPDGAEYEPPRQLLGQQPNGTLLPKP